MRSKIVPREAGRTTVSPCCFAARVDSDPALTPCSHAARPSRPAKQRHRTTRRSRILRLTGLRRDRGIRGLAWNSRACGDGLDQAAAFGRPELVLVVRASDDRAQM